MLDYANENKNILGQYFTPSEVVKLCLKEIKLNDIIIEPSCGTGMFLEELPEYALGIEIDSALYEKFLKNKNCINQNFYDFKYENDNKDTVTFIGNPPYRTPAYSLSTHKKMLSSMTKTYNVKGVKEEALFFIIKTFDIFKQYNLQGNIGYILPKNIFTCKSISFKTFKEFCNLNMTLLKVIDLPKSFVGVGQDLVFAVWEVNKNVVQTDTFLLNGVVTNIHDFWCPKEDVYTFNDIFKKTYLGSVPAESFLLSCKNETRNEFLLRLQKLYKTKVDKHNVIQLLSYNNEPHLRALKNNNKKKIDRVVQDINFWKNFVPFEVLSIENIKQIQHRKETRFYFRYKKLEKQKQFVYIVNNNPQASFYFPGNPTATSTDYWGFCDYDVNRNCSPGANRSVPLNNIKENIKEEFLKYWSENTEKDISEIFNYIDYVFKSEWYTQYKQSHQRFYFSVPKNFIKEFNNAQVLKPDRS